MRSLTGLMVMMLAGCVIDKVNDDDDGDWGDDTGITEPPPFDADADADADAGESPVGRELGSISPSNKSGCATVGSVHPALSLAWLGLMLGWVRRRR